jgi:hypothetical protein
MPGKHFRVGMVDGEVADVGAWGKMIRAAWWRVRVPWRRISGQRCQRLSNHQSW